MRNDSPHPDDAPASSVPLGGALLQSLGAWMRDWCDKNAGASPWSDGALAERAMPHVPFGLIREALQPQLTKIAAGWTRPQGITRPPAEAQQRSRQQAETVAYEQLTLALAVDHLKFLKSKLDASQEALRGKAEELAERLGVGADVLLAAAGIAA